MNLTRKVDGLGRVVLPMEFRKELNIGANCSMRIEIKNGSVVLTPNECVCSACKTIIPSGTKYNLCESCIISIKKEN